VPTLADIPTPRVFVDRARLAANIAAMQAIATTAGLRLRPHTKTHKSPILAKLQLAAGAAGICCAKLGEAEVMADAGIQDIRLPYPVNPSNASRVMALQDRAMLSIIVDDTDVAAEWSRMMAAVGRTLDVLVKVDVGFHRCGVNPDAPDVLKTIRAIASLPGLRFRGLLSHAGQSYGAESEEALAAIAAAEMAILTRLASDLRKTGRPAEEISVGSTPTARFIGTQKSATEMRPGNYVFFDRTQVGLGAATIDRCALGVVATVVSRPSPGRVIFDAGSKVLSSDGLRGFGHPVGYGLVFPGLARAEPDPSIVIERLSEEHGVARVLPGISLRPGDRVRILPNHACVVTNLTDELLLVDGLDIIDRIPVAARGRST
jgi:D-serine deaminase-like pyridoxal phosphate-dependent protein